MTATLHSLPSQKHVADAHARIETVRKVARDLWDVRDEETNKRRNLHAFEGLFLSAFRIIQQKRAKERHDGRVWGEHSRAYEALCNNSYRGEADELDELHAKYLRMRENFYNADLDVVAEQMDAAE